VKIKLQDASARLYDVEAPDDASVDDIAKSASIQVGRELRPIDRPSTGAYAWDSLKKGVATIPGLASELPRAMAPFAMRAYDAVIAPSLGIPDTTPAAQQKRAENAMGVEHLPAPSTLQKYLVGKPAEFAGASMLPSAGVVATAKRPLLALATEAASTYGGGVGAQAGEDVGEAAGKGVARLVGGNEEIGAHLGKVLGAAGGGLGGGSLTAMAAPRIVDLGVRGVAKVVPKLKSDSPEAIETMNSLFTRHFRESLLSDPRWKENLEQTLKTKDAINHWLETGEGLPGTRFEPDLSMATGTPSLKHLQQQVETQSPGAAARGVETRQRVAKALGAYRDGNFPAGEKTLQELSARELSVLEREVQGQQSRIDADLDRLRAKVRSGQFGPEEGRELEALKKEQLKAATALTDARYAQAYRVADQFGFQGSLDSLVGYMQRYRRDPNRVAQETPGFFGDLLSAAKQGSAATRRDAMRRAFGEDKLPDGITAFVARNGGLNKAAVGGDGLVDLSLTPAWAMRSEGSKGASFYLQHNGATARTPDAMRELAVEAGHLKPGSTIDDLYRAIEDEVSAQGPVHFSSNDWDRAASVLAKRKAEMDREMGGSDVGHAGGAEYPSSFGVLHSILKRIREEQRYYGGQQSDQARRAMGPLKDLETLTLAEVNKAGRGVGERLADADAYFKSTVAEPFYRGVAARAFNDRGLVENVAERLLNRGEEGAANFKQVYGGSERAHDLLWNGVLEAFAKQVGEKDVTPARAKAFYEDHRKFLDQFPTIRERLFTVDKVAQNLEDRAGQLAQQRQAVNRDLVSTLTNSSDPEGRLIAALGNEAQMRQVAGWAKKSPELGQSIVRSYVEKMEGMKDPAGFLAANEKGLKPLFDALGPNHWENVKNLMMGRTVEGRGAPVPVVKADVVDDPLKAITGTATSGIFSRIRGAVYQQISPEYVIADIGGRYFFRVHQDRARELVTQALYDPKLAQDILAMEKELKLPMPDSEKLRGLMQEMKVHYAMHGLRVGLGTFSAAEQDPADAKARARGDRALQRYWRH
jgi:hypothetical protein